MNATDLAVGAVVQLNPDTVKNRAFAGCFMVVSEPKPWGAQGYIQAVGEDRATPGPVAYYRARWEEMEWVGMATWILPATSEDA